MEVSNVPVATTATVGCSSLSPPSSQISWLIEPATHNCTESHSLQAHATAHRHTLPTTTHTATHRQTQPHKDTHSHTQTHNHTQTHTATHRHTTTHRDTQPHTAKHRPQQPTQARTGTLMQMPSFLFTLCTCMDCTSMRNL